MALDTFNPYLFVSAGEQSNKFLSPTYADGIAKFQAQRAQSLTGLTVRFDPIQEGSGDPSPDNIRPISGRTGLTVTRAGKNLLPITFTTDTANGITAAMQTNGTVKVTGTATNNAEIIIGEVARDNTKSYAVSGSPSGGSTTTYRQIVRLMLNDASLQTISDTGSGYIIPTTLQPTATSIRVSIWVASGQTVNLVYRPMVEFGNTVTAFEPYVGTTYPISWQTQAGTVYGGTLDLVSGELTVNWDYIASYDGETLPGEWISDRDVYAEGTTPTTGAEVAYKLAETVTYQLDPEKVMTVPGFNQIYSDAGPVIDIQF